MWRRKPRTAQAARTPYRAMRAAIAPRFLGNGTGACGRGRRGLLMFLPLSWRRCALGSNHIACHGVWRIGRRRQARRRNRSGETRWHLCRRVTPPLSIPSTPSQGARA